MWERLRRYTGFDEASIKEERFRKGAREENITKREGGRLLSRLLGASHVVALDRTGLRLTSKELAKRIGKLNDTGQDTTFVIDGAFGLQNVLNRSNWAWSLYAQTFPRDLA